MKYEASATLHVPFLWSPLLDQNSNMYLSPSWILLVTYESVNLVHCKVWKGHYFNNQKKKSTIQMRQYLLGVIFFHNAFYYFCIRHT